MPTCGFAVQVTELTVPAALSRSRLAVQPGMTSVCADATFGSWTLNLVVRAPVSDSPGTWKVSTDVAPGAGSSASTWTCASADPAPVASPMDITTPVQATVRRARLGALDGKRIRLSLSWCRRGSDGQRAQLTGGPRCDTDAESRRADRSG